MNILITGSKGFVGRNLVVALRREGRSLFEYDLESDAAALEEGLRREVYLCSKANTGRCLSTILPGWKKIRSLRSEEGGVRREE